MKQVLSCSFSSFTTAHDSVARKVNQAPNIDCSIWRNDLNVLFIFGESQTSFEQANVTPTEIA